MRGRPNQFVVGFICVMAALACLRCSSALAQATQPTTQPITPGESDIVFTDHSPQSAPKELARRFTHYKLKEIPDFDLSRYPYVMYVPPAPDPETGKYGLLVELADKDATTTPPMLHPIFDKFHLICIVPHQNILPEWHRAALGMDAAYNVQRIAPIDPHRVYLVAYAHPNDIGLMTSDVFNGNIAILGESYFREIRQLVFANHFERYPAKDPKPPGDLWLLALQRGQVRTISEGEPENSFRYGIDDAMKADGFQHIFSPVVTVEDIQYPTTAPDWVEQSLNFLDSLRPKPKPKPQPVAVHPSPPPRPVAPPVATAPAESPEAQDLLSESQSYIDNGLNDFARDKLNYLIQKYPDDPNAAKAKKLLAQLDGPAKK
jgi:hypothetical protein